MLQWIVFSVIALGFVLLLSWRVESRFCVYVLCLLQSVEEFLKSFRFCSKEDKFTSSPEFLP